MFGLSSQKPGGFAFGLSSNTSNSTPSLNFSNNNNNNNNSTNTNKPTGFSFGNASNTQSATTTSSNLGGFSFNKPAQPLGTSNTTTNNSFNFGNSNNNANKNITSKPSLFGNSSTNPAFGDSLSGLGMNFGQSSQTATQSPYGINFNQLANTEMPKSLTHSLSEDNSIKLKRKRTYSDSSSIENENKNRKSNKNVSLIGRIVDTFKTPSKYSIEDMRGLFSSTKKITKSNKDSKNDIIRSQFDNYSKSLGLDIPRIPASKSEYKRLIIKNPKESFANYEEIDANKVLMSKIPEYQFFTDVTDNKSKSKTVINELKPQSKRQRKDYAENSEKPELTFSKPLFEQQIKNTPKEKNVDDLTLTPSNQSEKSDYWCTPSISELKKLTSLELTHVPNFSVGRKNYAHMMYKYPVDLSAFEGRWDKLLGNTIIFQNRTLQVYSNAAEKPSQGNGLNVPAVITIEKAFPKKYDPLNPDFELIDRHIERLKSIHGMKFISFDPSNGTYVFEVEHFSIWGIVDEEDDDPEIVALWRKQQEMEKCNEKRKTDLQVNALEKIAGYGQPGDNWKRQKPDLVGIAPGGYEYVEEENENDEENNNERKLLTELDDDENGSDIADSSVPTGLSDQPEPNLELISKNSNLNDVDELVEVRAYEPEVKDIDMQFLNPKKELAISENWDEQLALSSGFFSVFNKNLDESNNIKLNPKNVSNFLFGDRDGSKLKRAIIEKPILFDNSLHYQKCLQAEIFEGEFLSRVNEIPQVIADSKVSLKIPLLSFENSNDYNIWELLSILYDNNYLHAFLSKETLKVCCNFEVKLNHIQDIKRRKLLCDFLQKLITLDLENSFSSNAFSRDTLDKIFYFVCTDKLGDAIQYAINTKNNHIAILLTMMDSNDPTVHKIAKSQLNEWSNASINFIPSGVLKLYKLLSGDILSKDYIDHLEGLTWPVVLFLMVKYGDSNKPLNDIIKEFISYAEKTGISEFPINQIYFSLLKIVNSSSVVLSSFDVELQFLLMKHLKMYIQYSSSEFDNVILKFSKKLEQKGMIKEASFVLEHLNDDELAKEKLIDLYNNNVQVLEFLENKEKLEQIHNMLHIPYSLLHEARSFEFYNIHEYYKSTLELLLAGNIKKAHELTLEKVAPHTIISNIPSELEKLVKLVSKFDTLSESKIGAGVYGDYIKIIKLADQMDYNNMEYESIRNKLKELYDSVLNGINSLKDTNKDVKIAKTIMVKKMISISFKEDLNNNEQSLLSLKLPESEKNYLESQIESPNNLNLLES